MSVTFYTEEDFDPCLGHKLLKGSDNLGHLDLDQFITIPSLNPSPRPCVIFSLQW